MTANQRPTDHGVRIDVRVMPRSPRTEVGGVREGRLLVRVTAAPVDQAANDAAIRALAEALDVARQSIRLVSGAQSRNKTFEIGGGVDSMIDGRLAELRGDRGAG